MAQPNPPVVPAAVAAAPKPKEVVEQGLVHTPISIETLNAYSFDDAQWEGVADCRGTFDEDTGIVRINQQGEHQLCFMIKSGWVHRLEAVKTYAVRVFSEQAKNGSAICSGRRPTARKVCQLVVCMFMMGVQLACGFFDTENDLIYLPIPGITRQWAYNFKELGVKVKQMTDDINSNEQGRLIGGELVRHVNRRKRLMYKIKTHLQTLMSWVPNELRTVSLQLIRNIHPNEFRHRALIQRAVAYDRQQRLCIIEEAEAAVIEAEDIIVAAHLQHDVAKSEKKEVDKQERLIETKYPAYQTWAQNLRN